MTIADLPPATFSAPSGSSASGATAEPDSPFSSFFDLSAETPAAEPAGTQPASGTGASLDQLLSFASFFLPAPATQAAVEQGSDESACADSMPATAEGEETTHLLASEADVDTELPQGVPVLAAAPQQPVHTASFGWSRPSADAPQAAASDAITAQHADGGAETAAQVEQVSPGKAAQQTAELAFAARVKPAGSPATGDAAPQPEIQQAEAPRADPGTSNGADSNSAADHSFQSAKGTSLREKAPRVEHAQGSISESSTLAAPVGPQTHGRSYASDSRTQELPSQPVEIPELRPEQTPGQRDVSVRIAGEGDSAVDVRIMERGGELRVAVRSDHTDLRESLRAELPDLRMRMDQHGFRTETWHPTQVAAMGDSARAEHEFSGSPRQQHPADEQPQQQRSRQQRPDWLEEIERQTAASA